MEDIRPIISVLFFISIIIFTISLVITLLLATVRWIFKINKQIELLTQIKDELRKSRLKKYPDKRED